MQRRTKTKVGGHPQELLCSLPVPYVTLIHMQPVPAVDYGQTTGYHVFVLTAEHCPGGQRERLAFVLWTPSLARAFPDGHEASSYVQTSPSPHQAPTARSSTSTPCLVHPSLLF
jgi:hypothetical protein